MYLVFGLGVGVALTTSKGTAEVTTLIFWVFGVGVGVGAPAHAVVVMESARRQHNKPFIPSRYSRVADSLIVNCEAQTVPLPGRAGRRGPCADLTQK